MKLPRKDVEKLAKAMGQELPPPKKKHKWNGDQPVKKCLYAGDLAFDKLCEAHGLPLPQSEYYFARWEGGDPACSHAAGILKCRKCGATRRHWKFDHIWQGWLVLEIQGGLFTEGRHVRGTALLDEYEKLNEAAILGYVVLFATPEQVNDGSVFALVRRALEHCEDRP